ncbi:MAG: hypothetical protein HDR12_08055 [Lachnospiraceae bacterium]|nr:hypothetical protein [Lachnospiraceae bacterium]
MKIGEAQQIYREQIKAYNTQKAALSKQLQDVRSRMEASPEDKEIFGSEAAVLELSIEALNKQQDEYQDYMDELSDQYCAYWNATVAEQQADAAKEYGAEMGKLMEVARRLMKGAIVPSYDEKKLMEFDKDLYQMAKSIGMLVRQQKKEKYDSLWEEEEEKEYDDPMEVAENAEAASDGPEVVDAETVIAEAVSEV